MLDAGGTGVSRDDLLLGYLAHWQRAGPRGSDWPGDWAGAFVLSTGASKSFPDPFAPAEDLDARVVHVKWRRGRRVVARAPQARPAEQHARERRLQLALHRALPLPLLARGGAE